VQHQEIDRTHDFTCCNKVLVKGHTHSITVTLYLSLHKEDKYNVSQSDNSAVFTQKLLNVCVFHNHWLKNVFPISFVGFRLRIFGGGT
jgi:hypothetical protein